MAPAVRCPTGRGASCTPRFVIPTELGGAPSTPRRNEVQMIVVEIPSGLVGLFVSDEDRAKVDRVSRTVLRTIHQR